MKIRVDPLNPRYPRPIFKEAVSWWLTADSYQPTAKIYNNPSCSFNL